MKTQLDRDRIAEEAIGQRHGSAPDYAPTKADMSQEEAALQLAPSSGAQASIPEKTAESVGERVGDAYSDSARVGTVPHGSRWLRPGLCHRSVISWTHQCLLRYDTGAISNHEASTGRQTSARLRAVNSSQNFNRAPPRHDDSRDHHRARSPGYRPGPDRERARRAYSGEKNQSTRPGRQVSFCRA